MTVRITGMRVFRARMAVGIWLVKLASVVMGVGITVERN